MEIIEEERGRIVPVAEGDYKTVLVIESKKGAKRANHYHKTDSHIMYIVSGRARYVEERLVQDGTMRKLVCDREVGPGDFIHTPPLNPHGMEFLEDTVMVVVSPSVRDRETYLNEIVPFKVL